ncbi:endonuclease NucS [Candidatus Micrarchaeota archaeon]|nr:endonuclease NucS [Candidatus Micrarchaeota archaeon]
MQLEEGQRVIQQALLRGRLCVVVGHCHVKYHGRAASKLSQGDRLLVVKPDGTFLVHQGKKMAAINYQGPGAIVSAELKEGALLVKAERSKPMNEVIEVSFDSLQAAHSFTLKDDENLRLFGSERQLADLLEQDLALIEPGLKPLKKEAFMRKGRIDLMAQDKKGALVAIELKRRNAGLDAVTQLKRYVDELSKRQKFEVRGILCAPEITANALKMLEREGLEFFKLDYEVSNPSAKIKGLEKKQKMLNEFR